MVHAQTKRRRLIVWRTVRTYESIYRRKPTTTDPDPEPIKVTTLTPPAKKRKFAGRVYRLQSTRIIKRKVVLMAKAAKKRKQDTKDIEDDELDELDELEAELEDLDEEDEDEDDDDSDEDEDDDSDDEDEDDEDDEDEDDEEEAPAPKSKKSKSKAKPSRSRTTDGKVGTAELAEAAGCDSRTLRMVLRKHKIAKDDETGRYEWSSLKHPEVKKILKLIEGGEADNVKKESLDKVKESASKKKGKKGKKSKK